MPYFRYLVDFRVPLRIMQVFVDQSFRGKHVSDETDIRDGFGEGRLHFILPESSELAFEARPLLLLLVTIARL
jgi:hypothetical protein